MSRPKRIRSRMLVALVASSSFLIAPLAAAQETPSAVGEVQITRDAGELQRLLHPRHRNTDTVDTAVVFTNTSSAHAIVTCVAFNKNGYVTGRIRLRVPGLGLRFALASDISSGRDFVGSVLCSTTGHLLGSALLIAPDLTDLPVEQGDRGPRISDSLTDFVPKISIRFPLVATY